MNIKLILTIMSAGALVITAAATQVLADESCMDKTKSWDGAGLGYTCYFEGISGGSSAVVSSYSRVDPQAPHKHQLIADMSQQSGNAGWDVWAYAQGYDSGGNPITSCLTQNDYSTAQGATVGNGDGCESATTHRLYAVRRQRLPR